MSETYWEIDNNLVSEGTLTTIDDGFYDGFNDQGYMKYDSDLPKDNIFCKKKKHNQILVYSIDVKASK